MREWVPVSTSPKGRLALAAVRAFGARAFDEVTVGELAAEAGGDDGALYHHFESKLGLYVFVRQDVERRLLDRMEGAAARPAERPSGRPCPSASTSPCEQELPAAPRRAATGTPEDPLVELSDG